MFKKNILISRIMGIEAVRRQSLISIFWSIAYTIIGFFSTMYFARAVGAGVLGAYFLFMAYYGIISMLSEGGFGGAAVKRISEGEEPDAFFSAFFVIRSIFVVLTVVVLIAFRRYFVDLDGAGTFIWLIVALIMSIFYGTIHGGIAGRGKMGIYSTTQFINNISRIFVQVVAVFFGFGVAGLAGGFVAGMIIVFIVELRFFDLHFVRFSWAHIKSLSTFSFWLFLTASGMQVFSYADIVIIGYYLENADIGVYRIMLQLAGISAFTTSALRMTLWPKVSRWGKTGEFELIETSLSRAFSYSLILAVPVLAGGVLLGDRLIYFFYGSEFQVGYIPFVILLIVQIVNVFNYFFTTYLNALNRVKDSFKVTMVGASANIILNIILIPLIGITGAALATLFTMSLNAIFAHRILSQIMRIRIEYDSVFNILKASALMSTIVLIYRLFVSLSNIWFTLVPVVVGAVVYVVMILKLDKKIHDELKDIVVQMNLPWPTWFHQ